MKKLNLIHYALFMILLSIFSCIREDLTETNSTSETTVIDIPRVSSFPDQAKVQISKWLAHTCNENKAFKKHLFQSIINLETGECQELFVLDFINRRYESGFVKDAIIEANNITEAEFTILFSEVKDKLYNLVLDIPDFITWYFHRDYHFTGLKDNYHTFPFVFYPDIKQKNNNNKWVGFGHDDMNNKNYSTSEGLVVHEIGAKEGYHEIIPIFIKQAELNVVFAANIGRDTEEDILIDRYYGDVISDGKDCIKSAINEVATPVNMGGTLYQRVDIMKLKEKTKDCNTKLPPTTSPPPSGDEICGNGIDDDGDGAIDEGCVYEFEINCMNGIDDDADGLIDGNDPDCACNCTRDCRKDNNYLARHAFDNVSGYYVVTSENIPGVEKLINLRYDITRLNASACPPGLANCPFTTNHKFVVDRATRLLCAEEYIDPEEWWQDGLDPNDIATHCILDEAGWSAKPDGFFYGYITRNNSAPCSGYGSNDCLFFSILNGYTAVLIGTNYWVAEKVYYLPASGDGNLEDWDASIYGSLIRVNISEVDNDNLTNANVQAQTYTLTTQFEASAGIKIIVPDVFEGTSGYKYVTTNQLARTVSNTFTVQASNLVYLGDIDLIYCDDQDVSFQGNNVLPGSQRYNKIDEQNGMLNWWDVIFKY